MLRKKARSLGEAEIFARRSALHLDLYAGYVKQVNALTQELSEMRSS